MKSLVLVAALSLAYSSAALAEGANSHADHHSGTAQGEPAQTATPPQATPSAADGTMSCPMMKGAGQGMMMQNGQMMQSGQMMQAPSSGSSGTKCPMAPGTDTPPVHPDHTMTLHHDTAPNGQ